VYCRSSPDLFFPYQEVPNELEMHIKLFRENSHVDVVRHHILFLQSSGYGKTRLCLNLLQKKYLGLYFMCQDGGFSCSLAIRKLKDDFQAAKKEPARDACVEEFLQRIEAYAKSFASPAALFEQQFTADRYNAAFLDPSNLPAGCPSVSDEPQIECDANFPVAKAGVRLRGLNNPLLIIFDDAASLGDALMGKLKIALDGFDMIGVFLSACGQLYQLPPVQVSSRRSGRRPLPPICYLPTTDIHKGHKFFLGRPLWYSCYMSSLGGKPDQLIQLVRIAVERLKGGSMTTPPETFHLALFMCRFGGLYPVDYTSSSDFVMNHMAKYTSIGEETVGGHAQVSSTIAYPSEPILAEASAYCTSGLNEFDDDDDDDDAFSNDNCDDDVEDSVAASVDGDVLKRIAKKFAPVYCVKEAVLTTVKKQLAGRDPLVTTNKGSLGEFLGCALVGYQLDYIRANKIRESGSEYDPSGDHNNMSSPIPAKDFLCALFQDADENGRLSVLDEYMLNATHFIRLPYKPSNSTCVTAFARGAAVITYEGSRTLDFFMEAVRDLPSGGLYQNATPSNSDTDSGQCDESGKVDTASSSDGTPRYDNVHIRVAIKNYANDISRSQADKLLNMSAVNCEPVGATGIAGKEKLFVVVVINIGKGRLEPFQMVPHVYLWL
jgi:hypothetical protein